MIPAIEIETGPGPECSIIWLHGLGADGSDFAPMAEELQLPFATRFIFPHAPVRPVTLNGGYQMRAWYDLYDRTLDKGEDEQGIKSAQGLIGELIDNENRRGIPYKNIFLAGFSQGGALALRTGLCFRQPLCGILALSTYLPLSTLQAQDANPANSDIAIFMAHGDRDDIIPVEIGQKSRQALESLGYRVKWRTYSMPHSVSDAEIADIGAWLRQTFSAGESATE